MIIGIEDNSKQNFAFSVPNIIAVESDPTSAEYCLLYLAHIDGHPLRIHHTPAEFMSKIGGAMEQIQGRANLLGMMQGAKQ